MNTASPRQGVVAVIEQAGCLLVVRRSQHVVAPGHYCFPGGGIEPGETEPQALIREMQEELNCTIKPISRLWRSTTPWQVDLSWWQAELLSPIMPNPAEIESAHWLNPEQILAQSPLLESNRQFILAWQGGQVQLRRWRR